MHDVSEQRAYDRASGRGKVGEGGGRDRVTLKCATPQVSEILNSIKVIKMFAWERPLAQRISDIRCMEVDRLKQYGYVSALQVRHLSNP